MAQMAMNIGRLWGISPDYRDFVNKAIEEKSNQFIQCNSFIHSRYLLYLLIYTAKMEIKIFSYNLSEAIYRDNIIRTRLSDAVNRGVKITIIVENDITRNQMKFCENHNITTRLLEKQIKNPNHFILVDNTAFRLESTNTKYSEKDFCKGTVNFNKQEWADRINRRFSELIDRSRIIEG